MLLRIGSLLIDCKFQETLLHFSLQGFRLDICYYHQDLHWTQLHLGSRLSWNGCVHAHLHVISEEINGITLVWCSSAIHFRGCRIRQVSCYTLLSGCRLPWPPSCCLNTITPFVVSININLGTLVMLLVHPKSPVLLTKTGPLRLLFIYSHIRSLRVG